MGLGIPVKCGAMIVRLTALELGRSQTQGVLDGLGVILHVLLCFGALGGSCLL